MKKYILILALLAYGCSEKPKRKPRKIVREPVEVPVVVEKKQEEPKPKLAEKKPVKKKEPLPDIEMNDGTLYEEARIIRKKSIFKVIHNAGSEIIKLTDIKPLTVKVGSKTLTGVKVIDMTPVGIDESIGDKISFLKFSSLDKQTRRMFSYSKKKARKYAKKQNMAVIKHQEEVTRQIIAEMEADKKARGQQSEEHKIRHGQGHGQRMYVRKNKDGKIVDCIFVIEKTTRETHGGYKYRKKKHKKKRMVVKRPKIKFVKKEKKEGGKDVQDTYNKQ